MPSKNKIIYASSVAVLVSLFALAMLLYFRGKTPPPPASSPIEEIAEDEPVSEVIATGFKIPWDIAFLPDKSILITERAGNLIRLEKDGTRTSISLPRPVSKGEGGLLGIVTHPDFETNNFLYLYMTIGSNENGTENAVFRYRYVGEQLLDEKTIITRIPGALYHDGGRMEFGPDGLLYITTGDAQDPNIAQDKNSLGGKILRLYDDGKIPKDNPFNSPVFSLGHRNPQGLTWDNLGQLWESEHGRSGALSGYDEINLIKKGSNYGWPKIEGGKTEVGMELPKLHSGSESTWAPASLVYYKGKLFFGGLRGEALYEVSVVGETIGQVKTYFHKTFGRLRTVRLGPDGMLYLTTSNQDGRGKPIPEDDRIIKVNPNKL